MFGKSLQVGSSNQLVTKRGNQIPEITTSVTVSNHKTFVMQIQRKRRDTSFAEFYECELLCEMEKENESFHFGIFQKRFNWNHANN